MHCFAAVATATRLNFILYTESLRTNSWLTEYSFRQMLKPVCSPAGKENLRVPKNKKIKWKWTIRESVKFNLFPAYRYFLSTAIRRFDYIFMVLTVIGLAQFIYLLISLVQSARMWSFSPLPGKRAEGLMQRSSTFQIRRHTKSIICNFPKNSTFFRP